MIALVKRSDDEIVKTFIRDRRFHEVREDNKKIDGGELRSSNIKSVIWLKGGKACEMALDKWIALAEENDFWNINN